MKNTVETPWEKHHRLLALLNHWRYLLVFPGRLLFALLSFLYDNDVSSCVWDRHSGYCICLLAVLLRVERRDIPSPGPDSPALDRFSVPVHEQPK